MNQQQTCNLAMTSLILGLLGFLLGFLTGIPAIITGHVARKKIRQSNGILAGDGMALAGLILGYIFTIIPIIIIVIFALFLIFAGSTGLAPFVYTLY